MPPVTTSPVDAPVGLPLSTFTVDFPTVPAEADQSPACTLDLLARLAPAERQIIDAIAWDPRHERRLAEVFDPAHDLHRIPADAAAQHLSIVERCMVQASSGLQTAWHDWFHTEEGDTERRREHGCRMPWDPHARLYGKITNCMWRTAYGRGSWNTLVGVYEALRRFDFGLAGFETRLDWATYHNEKGYSAAARVYLDGGLGLLVHHRGRHVLTIGLNVDDRRNVYLMQVQARHRTGNRWMYQVPGDLVAHVVRRLDAAFGSTFQLHLVDGAALATSIDQNYARLRERQAEYATAAARGEALSSAQQETLAAPTPTPETLAHIAATYDRPIAGYTRGCTPSRAAGVACWPLHRAARPTPAPASRPRARAG